MSDGTTRPGKHHQNVFLRYLPILQWLPKYKIAWLGPDIVAGLTIWAVIVPEAMAYAGIAGVPPIVGLYTVPIPLIAYALFGTSQNMVIGPDSATALISGVTIGAIVAAHGGEQYVALTATMALVVGVLFLLFGLLRMGWVANFIPEPAMKGFIQGLVWVTIIGQVPKIFGVKGGSGNFFEKTWDVVEKLPGAHLTTTVVGIGSLVVLLLLKRFLPKVPSSLTVAALAVVVATVFGLEEKGVEVVGTLKGGLPALGLPKFTLDQLEKIVPAALAIVLLGYAESLGAAKAAAAKLGGEIDPDQELVSHGPANIGSALSGGFVVVGSLSKTSVAMGAGGKSQLSSLVCAVLVILTLMFLLPLFKNLPHATLAAIVIEAMLGLADFAYLKRLRGISVIEFAIALASLFGVLILGVLQGIGLGVVLALLILVYRASYPRVAVLGKAKAEDDYRDIVRHPEATTVPGLLIFRFSASPVFFNANHFADELKRCVGAAEAPVKEVLVDAEIAALIDTTASEMLLKLRDELSNQGIGLSFARTEDSVRDKMRLTGVEEAIGAERFYATLDEGVRAFSERE